METTLTILGAAALVLGSLYYAYYYYYRPCTVDGGKRPD
jgi:disulfide bond formation protein DsbB